MQFPAYILPSGLSRSLEVFAVRSISACAGLLTGCPRLTMMPTVRLTLGLRSGTATSPAVPCVATAILGHHGDAELLEHHAHRRLQMLHLVAPVQLIAAMAERVVDQALLPACGLIRISGISSRCDQATNLRCAKA